MDRQKLTVEVTSTGPIENVVQRQCDGWGEESENLTLEGKVAQIVVKKDGESKFGIVIKEDGSIIITSYDIYFTQAMPQNLHLTNERPWNEKEKKSDSLS